MIVSLAKCWLKKILSGSQIQFVCTLKQSGGGIDLGHTILIEKKAIIFHVQHSLGILRVNIICTFSFRALWCVSLGFLVEDHMRQSILMLLTNFSKKESLRLAHPLVLLYCQYKSDIKCVKIPVEWFLWPYLIEVDSTCLEQGISDWMLSVDEWSRLSPFTGSPCKSNFCM